MTSDRYIHYADLHSHNRMPAVFSKTDDHDERATRVYMVVGRLDRYSRRSRCASATAGASWRRPEQVLEMPPVGHFPPEWLTQICTDAEGAFGVAVHELQKRPVKIVMLGAGDRSPHCAAPLPALICVGASGEIYHLRRDKVEPKIWCAEFTEADLGENKAR
ncbi:MAG: hypothetical protein ACLRJV_21190 [Eubacteriales bacterium]